MHDKSFKMLGQKEKKKERNCGVRFKDEILVASFLDTLRIKQS